jgi:pectate lyase
MAMSRMLTIVIAIVPSLTLAASPDFTMAGFATTGGGTTGGAGGIVKTINTLQQLADWAASREKNTTPEIVTISGKITGSGDTTLITIKNGANITIQGNGTAGELSGAGLNIRDYTNVIVRNLKIHEVLYPDDALTLDNVQRGWVDHCELYSKTGPGITVDTYDGLLDIKKGSSGITVSWCYLHDHMKCSLVGHTDNTGQQEEDSRIRVTYHHNNFVNTDGRNPSLRFGAVHMFNNYYGDITDYGLAARDGGHAKVENCCYENVKLPMSTDKFPVEGLPDGYICQSGNVFSGTCGGNEISQAGCDFWNSSTLPYSYTLDAVGTVKATVQKYAGCGNNASTGINGNAAAPSEGGGAKRVFTVHTALDDFRALTGDAFDVRGRKIAGDFLKGKPRFRGIYFIGSIPGK